MQGVRAMFRLGAQGQAPSDTVGSRKAVRNAYGAAGEIMGRPGATPRRLGLLTAPRSVSHARNFVRDALVTANVGTDVVERATLLVSELVTNTVVHTLSSSVEITVRSSPVVRVEVRDWSDGLPEMRLTGPRDGHGLSVVEALASRWGVDPLPDGKAIWIEFDPSD